MDKRIIRLILIVELCSGCAAHRQVACANLIAKAWQEQYNHDMDTFGLLRACSTLYVQGEDEVLSALLSRVGTTEVPCLIMRKAPQNPKDGPAAMIGSFHLSNARVFGGTFDGKLPVEP
jgi:hypothetical protein